MMDNSNMFRDVEGYDVLTSSQQQRYCRAALSHWTACLGIGRPVRVWVDDAGTLCVEWSCGTWWHYTRRGEWY